VIVVRRSTAVRVGLAAGVVAALAVGFGVGWSISSSSYAASTDNVVTEAATTPMSSPSAMSSAISPATSSTLASKAVSCRSGSSLQVEPTSIDIGCDGDTVISSVTWSSWGSHTAMGSGTLALNNCQPSCTTGGISSSPAFVVLSDPVKGVFQDVLITPPAGALTPQSSAHPGSGWGSG
jgi:hypothetical protein